MRHIIFNDSLVKVSSPVLPNLVGNGQTIITVNKCAAAIVWLKQSYSYCWYKK